MAKKSKYPNIPAYTELFNSTLSALIALGGSGSNAEINQKVYELADISEEMTSVPHAEGEDGKSEIDYRLAWSRSYLKVYGLIRNSSRGIWTLNDMSIDPEAYDSADIVKKFRDASKKGKKVNEKDKSKDDTQSLDETPRDDVQEMALCDELDDFNWKDTLLHTLYQINPAAFERLTQRLLRESGFSKVEVTGKVGDGGIDGKGIVNFHGLLSFHVVFQCKRYRGAVSSRDIRDFRGAMQGRADKGLFITTGTFTKDATKEATRDGAPPIDLIDGDALCDKLKELRLGMSVELVERVTVDSNWFDKI